MLTPPDIRVIARKQPILQDTLNLIYQKEQNVPGAVTFSISRYSMLPHWSLEDTGMMVYQHAKEKNDQHMELRFCIAGNTYCINASCNDSYSCRKSNSAADCRDKALTMDVFTFHFSAAYLSSYVKGKAPVSHTDEILGFHYPSSFTKIVPLCGRIRMVLESLLVHQYEGALENIFVNAQIQSVLLFSIECLLGDKDEGVFRCKFLSNDEDREKISKAREILLKRIGEPITIRELSKKVAINECYLKKGFKEMFGSTIFEFYQCQRMEHARNLLFEKGLSVTEVSFMLGYSSISHFSTAFKKHTGIKPCELLLR